MHRQRKSWNRIEPPLEATLLPVLRSGAFDQGFLTGRTRGFTRLVGNEKVVVDRNPEIAISTADGDLVAAGLPATPLTVMREPFLNTVQE